jgi:hypothetical protein
VKAEIGERLVAVALILGGLFLLWEGTGYRFGTLAQIGPGFFLVVVGVGIAAVAMLLLFSPRQAEGQEAPAIALRPLVLLPAAVLVFSFGLERVGIVPTVLAMTLLICAADRHVTPALTVLVVVLVLALAVGLFHFGFGVPVPLWRWPA